jgi:hypothetical protein
MTETHTYSYTALHIESINKQSLIYMVLAFVPIACFFLYWLIFRELTQTGFWMTIVYVIASIGIPYYSYNKTIKQAKELVLTITEYKISLSFVAFTNVLKEIDTKEIKEVKHTTKGLELYSKFDHKFKPLFISNGFEKFDEITQIVKNIATKNAADL